MTPASPSRTSTHNPLNAQWLFPSITNVVNHRTKHCWQNYVDYHKCVNAKGEDFRPCRQVFTPPCCDGPQTTDSSQIANANSSTLLSAPSAPRLGLTVGTPNAVRIS
jgi:hypothetical protein